MFKHARCQLAGLHVAKAKDATNTFINIHLFVARFIPGPCNQALQVNKTSPVQPPTSPLLFSTDVRINKSTPLPADTAVPSNWPMAPFGVESNEDGQKWGDGERERSLWRAALRLVFSQAWQCTLHLSRTPLYFSGEHANQNLGEQDRREHTQAHEHVCGLTPTTTSS